MKPSLAPVRSHEDFTEHVLSIVETIPPGRVMTYGDIAAVLGSRGARRVGQVMSHYGSDVPWWRVIRAGGYPPVCHDKRAREFYEAEGTPLSPAHTESGYRIDQAARWMPDD